MCYDGDLVLCVDVMMSTEPFCFRMSGYCGRLDEGTRTSCRFLCTQEARVCSCVKSCHGQTKEKKKSGLSPRKAEMLG